MTVAGAGRHNSVLAGIMALAFAPKGPSADLAYLHSVAHVVVGAAKVVSGESIPGGGVNTTGFTLRVPGGTRSFYPAFWIRDAAMMLGADLVPASETEGWIRVVAATQAGPGGLTFPRGLTVPPFSIPDHITLQGVACWYPGAYADQGTGAFGQMPPADDAFYFVQMAYSLCRAPGFPQAFHVEIKTPWGVHPLSEVCDRAFDSVEVDAASGLVVCDERPDHSRVDWGFCDSIHKSGKCLMPSLLRWQAARRLASLNAEAGEAGEALRYRGIAAKIASYLAPTFFARLGNGVGMLRSATGVGAQDDVWASAFAVWLGLLPHRIATAVARHLAALATDGTTVVEGQVRQIPKLGPFGGYWEQAMSARDTYQNGGYWATPTGWMVVALATVDRAEAARLLASYASYVRAHQSEGAPFEWINPFNGVRSNGAYASSAGLVFASIASRRASIAEKSKHAVAGTD